MYIKILDPVTRMSYNVNTLNGKNILRKHINQVGCGHSCNNLKKNKSPKCIENTECIWIKRKGCFPSNTEINKTIKGVAKKLKINKPAKLKIVNKLSQPDLYNIDDPNILKTYMDEFIRHFKKKNHICFFWAFKILELSNPDKKKKKKKKKKINHVSSSDLDLSITGNIKSVIPIPISPSDKHELIYNNMGDISYHGPFGGTTSHHGFIVSDLKSCLQKYIRRGETDKAIRVILELDRLYLYEQSINKSCGLRTNMINRLRIMACEDFADSNINMIPLCNKYINIWIANRDTDYIKGVKALVRIIKIFEQVEKSRMISFIRATYKTGLAHQSITGKYSILYDNLQSQTSDLMDIPVNLQKQKCSARFKRRNCEYIVWEFLLNYCALEPQIKNIVNINLEWYKTSSQKEYWIYLFNSIKICLGEFNYRLHVPITDPGISDTIIETLLLTHLTTPLVLDDYCFDQHTKRGRAAGRSHIYFSTTGSRVSNESDNVVNIYKDIYQDLKILTEKGVLLIKPIPTGHIDQWEHMYKKTLGTIVKKTPKNLQITIKKRKKKKKKPTQTETASNSAMSIVQLLKLYVITDLTKSEYQNIIKLPQGQKLTSSSKKSVFISKEYVYKGPFGLDDVKFINNIRFTRALKILERLSGVPAQYQSLLEFKIKHFSGYYYLVYKNIAIIPPSTISHSHTTKVISKSAGLLASDLGEPSPSVIVKIYPRGVVKRISDIINLYPAKFTNEIKIATLQHLYFRYLLNAGDSGTQNVLYREDGSDKLIAGIDMEENRLKDQGDTKLTYLFNSKFNKKVALFRDFISKVTPLYKSSLDIHDQDFKSLGFDIYTIKLKIDKFNSSLAVP